MKGRIFPDAGKNGGEMAAGPVWLTDEPEEAGRLRKAGECVAFVLTEENRNADLSGVTYCFEADAGRPFSPGEETDCGRWTEWIREQIGEEELLKVWQRHAGLPWHIADTERLSIREMTEADGETLYEIQKDAQDAGFLEPMEKDPRGRREQLGAYCRHVYGFYGFGIWTVTLKSNGRVIGRAGLEMVDGFSDPCLGFVIDPGERGKGYGEEACRAVLKYGFEELLLPAVRARVRRDNEASLHLCGKLGFVADKTAGKPKDLWTDLCLAAGDFGRIPADGSGAAER